MSARYLIIDDRTSIRHLIIVNGTSIRHLIIVNGTSTRYLILVKELQFNGDVRSELVVDRLLLRKVSLRLVQLDTRDLRPRSHRQQLQVTAVGVVLHPEEEKGVQG